MEELDPQIGPNEQHGESWAAGALEDDDQNLDDGLAELGLGDGADVLEEYDPQAPAAEGELGNDLPGNFDDSNLFLEAEEEAPKPVSAAMRKKQREHEEHLHLLEQVKALCIKMEKALEADAEDVKSGKPGLRKLTMLSEIETCASQVKAQSLLLQSGFLGLLKGFLEPLETPRGNSGDFLLALPHMQIRSLVYKLLGMFPISTHNQDGRNILKSSGIGPVLRFYAKVKHETEANRRCVQDLLNRWMLPIIEEGRSAVKDELNEAQRMKAAEAEMRRRRELDKLQDTTDQQRLEHKQANMRIGDAGYRYHARVPKLQRPDYVRAPTVPDHIRHVEKGKVTKEKGVHSKLQAATRKLQSANKVGAAASTKLEKATKNVGNDIV